MESKTGLTVELVGENGNALNLISICKKVMRNTGLSKEQQDEFQKEALSGDYDNVLQTCNKWFDCI